MALAQSPPQELTWGDALRIARETLSKSPRLVRERLVDAESEEIVFAAARLSKIAIMNRADLYSKVGEVAPEGIVIRCWEFAAARVAGRVLHHVTGTRVFLDHEYEVSPEVLVPRPETELLVSKVAEVQAERKLDSMIGIEIGVGSGAISIELLSQFQKLRMIATELSPGAARVASRNATRILGEGSSRLEIKMAAKPWEVLEPVLNLPTVVSSEVAFIVSNPPYLVPEDPIEDETREQEPHEALFAPVEDPLHFYRAIATGASFLLAIGGWVFVEIPPERAEQILRLFPDEFWIAKLLLDLNGRNRILVARLWTK